MESEPLGTKGHVRAGVSGPRAEFRRRRIAALDLDSGDSVLELGCGPGNSFAPLGEAVGPDGPVAGVDDSHGTVQRANGRIGDADRENVHAVQADATEPGLVSDSFDAAYAAMSTSAMPDPRAVVEAVAACLRPDGRLAVLDARPFQIWVPQVDNSRIQDRTKHPD